MLRTLPTCCSFQKAGHRGITYAVRVLYISAIIFGTAAAGAAAPSITGVYNAGSWIPPSLPNSGVAQGAYLTVTGSGLGPASLVVAGSYPLQTTQGLAGTTVQVTVGGVTQTCIMYYTSGTQVSAILPSATPVGNGTLTVSYQGGFGSTPIQVVPASFGMFTLNSAGTGAGSITDVNYNPITMINAAHPGETIVLWGTGLGAVSGDETEPPTPSNFPGVQVLIENQLVTPAYAGRSSYPGLDQINVTIPAGISGGCKTSIGVVVNGVVGNVVSTSVAPAGQTTCGDSFGALTTTNLETAVANGSLKAGIVDLSRVGTVGDDTLLADFVNIPVNSLIRSYGGSFAPSIGSCITYELVAGADLVLTDPVLPTVPHLDAGSSVTAAGAKSVTVGATSPGLYEATVGTSGDAFLSPGTYSFSNGSGGTQVPAFDWSVTLPSPVVDGAIPTTINRSSDLTVTWSNSGAFSVVSILGFSAVVLTSTQFSYSQFVCLASASANQFKIPASILSLLPTNGYGSPGAPGVGIQIAGVVDNRLSAPGLDTVVFTMFTSTGKVAKAQ
jgi:uncharacterized protein (TIGR03437 family)